MRALIELKAVQYRQDTGTVVLDNLNLSLAAGELLCLLGSAGSGKSSLLRLLAGIDRPRAGQLVRPGQAEGRLNPGELGQVFAAPALMPWASLATNVELPLRLLGQPEAVREAAARQALAHVGLLEQADRAPRDLSPAQRWLAALARAIVGGPRLVLLDEPWDETLPQDTRVDLMQTLRQVVNALADQAGGAPAWVLATRDVDLALAVGDRISLLGGRPGRILKTWSPEATWPRQEATRAEPGLQAVRKQILSAQARAEEPAVAG